MTFDEWWDGYKHKVPGPKRRSVKHWAKVGWDAHIFELEQEELRDREHTAKMVEEYYKAGCPQGWWGDFS